MKPFQVLCIDDEPTQLAIYSQLLLKEGFVIETAPDAQYGLTMCAQKPYDVVLTDYQMPTLNGLEFIDALKSILNPPPVVMLTARGNEDIAVQAMKLGAMDYIVKDDKQGYLKLLSITLHKAIASHQSRQEKQRMDEEREKLIAELRTAAANVKKLSGLVPICSSCKKIRDDKGFWNQIEAYLQAYSDLQLTHGLCPECANQLYPQLSKTPDNITPES
jgi:DNA-binding NtrC family response regulator